MVPKECRGLSLRVTFIHRTPALSADLWPCVIPKSLEQIILTETTPSSASKRAMHPVIWRMWLLKTSEHILLLYLSLSSVFFHVLSLSPNSFIALCYHIVLFYLPLFFVSTFFSFVNTPSSLRPPILPPWSQMHAGYYTCMWGVRVSYLRSVI